MNKWDNILRVINCFIISTDFCEMYIYKFQSTTIFKTFNISVGKVNVYSFELYIIFSNTYRQTTSRIQTNWIRGVFRNVFGHFVFRVESILKVRTNLLRTRFEFALTMSCSLIHVISIRFRQVLL